MEASLDAIVLRRRDAGENDRRVTLLTRERGKLDAIAKGARKAGSRLAAGTEPLAQIRVHLAARRNAYITQIEPRVSRPGLRSDYARLAGALSLAELYGAVLPHEQEDSEAFDLLEASLHALESHPRPAVAALYSQARLLEHSGVMPDFASGEGGEAFVSPIAGGVVALGDAERHADRFPVRFEVLVALDRIGRLPEPPRNVRYVEACLATLLPFWRNLAEAALPATATFVELVAAQAGGAG